MVAVVDPAAQVIIEKRPAPPAGMPRTVVQDHRPAGLRQTNGGGQTCQTGPDDMNASRWHLLTYNRP